MLIGSRIFWTWIGLLVGVLALEGCSKTGKVEAPLNPTEENLQKIGKAHVQSCYRLGRPPKDIEELKPSFEGEFSNDLLRSPNDGEDFVIIWNIDFNKLPPNENDPFTVGAYEKRGTGGKRYVLRFPTSVVRLTDEEFSKAVFPPGHAPPQ